MGNWCFVVILFTVTRVVMGWALIFAELFGSLMWGRLFVMAAEGK
jgi:hypothetical protein